MTLVHRTLHALRYLGLRLATGKGKVGLRKQAAPSVAQVLVVLMIIALQLSAGPGDATGGEANGARASANVVVEAWTRPQRGWLYVLDSNAGRVPSQILLIDPRDWSVKGKISAAYDPDMILSPDGSVLYVASGHTSLVSINTTTGAMEYEADFTDRQMYGVFLSFTGMAISPDGKWLYIRRARHLPDRGDYSVAVFDTETRRFLPNAPPIPCENGRLYAGPSQQGLVVLCTSLQSVRRLLIGANGVPLQMSDIRLKDPDTTRNKGFQAHVIRTLRSSSPDTLVWFLGDGRLIETDSTGGAIRRVIPSSLGDRCLMSASLVFSPDQSKIYVGSAPITRDRAGIHVRDLPDRIHIYDAPSGSQTAAFATSIPFSNLSMNGDGTVIYSPSGPRHSSILVIDAMGGREITTVRIDALRTPCMIIVAP